MMEAFIEFIIGISDLVVGESGRKMFPMFAALFFYILMNNLIGIIPGMTPPTDNINTTVSLGVLSFLVYNYYGIKEHGWGYLKHFLGPVLWLDPLMCAIEIVSHCIRPLTLGLRLYGNILADHTVVSVFIDMFSPMWIIPVPMIFYGLSIFISFVQAFVFTMLSMIYISMATAHDH